MSLIHLKKHDQAWHSRVEGDFLVGAHPIETVRKGLPEAMAQTVVNHCAIAQEDVVAFVERMMKELSALTLGAVDNIAPPSPPPELPVPAEQQFAKNNAGALHRLTADELLTVTPVAIMAFAPIQQGRDSAEYIDPAEIGNRQPVRVEPRRARVPRKAAAVAPPKEDI